MSSSFPLSLQIYKNKRVGFSLLISSEFLINFLWLSFADYPYYVHRDGALKKFVCLLCAKSFTRKIILATHECGSKDILSYHCYLCEYKCKETEMLEVHLVEQHQLPNNDFEKQTFQYTYYICPMCGKKYSTKEKLVRHIRVECKKVGPNIKFV